MADSSNTAKVEIRLTDNTVIKGLLNIRRYNRVSDFLNSKDTDQFLTIYDVVMGSVKHKFITINRDHIIWAIPEE